MDVIVSGGWTPWLVIGGIAAVAAVIAVLIAGKTRRKPTPAAPRPAPAPSVSDPAPKPPPPPAAALEINFRATTLDEWVLPNGRPAMGHIADGAYRLEANQRARSKASIPATPGATYRLDYAVSAASDAGEYRVAPLFLDAAGEVVGAWVRQPAIASADGVRRAHAEAQAPPDAASVHVGLYGAAAKEGEIGGVLLFSAARLTPV